MTMQLWRPWIAETKALINSTARFVFAALTLTFLILANVGAVLVIANQIKGLAR